jgi:hypothetical protein
MIEADLCCDGRAAAVSVLSSCAVELPLLFYDEDHEDEPFEGRKFLNRRNERNGCKDCPPVSPVSLVFQDTIAARP